MKQRKMHVVRMRSMSVLQRFMIAFLDRVHGYEIKALSVNLKVKMTFKRYSVMLDFVFTPMYSVQTCRYKSRKILIVHMRTN